MVATPKHPSELPTLFHNVETTRRCTPQYQLDKMSHTGSPLLSGGRDSKAPPLLIGLYRHAWPDSQSHGLLLLTLQHPLRMPLHA